MNVPHPNGHEKHGMAKTSEYKIWQGIKDRCCNQNYHSYENYGGRGISICNRWKSSFVAFYQDMGPRPSNLHSLDRINNDGNYEQGNCRWATKYQQAANKRPNKSGYLGVYKQGNGWRAGINISLGIYLTREQAAQAYNDAIIKLRGQDAVINQLKNR